MKRALFISRTGALSAAFDAALDAGFTPEEAHMRCRHYPVYRRGELKGFEAWVPHGTGARPLLEQ